MWTAEVCISLSKKSCNLYTLNITLYYTTGLKVEQSILEVSSELGSIVVDHLLEKTGVILFGFPQIVHDLGISI